MNETRYIISDAAKLIDVEPHVLRYWEEELGMDIPRNEMGHRYYTDREVKLFTQVRDLKEKGFQLKAIKMILTTVSEDMPSNIISLDKVRKNYTDNTDGQAASGQKMLNNQTFEDTHHENAQSAGNKEKEQDNHLASEQESAGLNVGQSSIVAAITAEDKMKHFKYIMDGIVMQALKKNNQELEDQVTGRVIKEMDYLFRMQEEKDEDRFRNLDEAIRKKQKGRKEAAAAKIPVYSGPKQKKRLFHKKDVF